jgi:hypothetical protein
MPAVGAGFREDTPVPQTPATLAPDLLSQLCLLTPDAIRARLDAIDEERRVLCAVLRSTLDRDRRRRRNPEVASA